MKFPANTYARSGLALPPEVGGGEGAGGELAELRGEGAGVLVARSETATIELTPNPARTDIDQTKVTTSLTRT